MPSPPAEAARLPRLPLAWFALAHVALAAGLVPAIVAPGRFLGAALGAPFAGLVHAVTLGWISSTIFGALYLVAPLVLRWPLAPRALDYALLALWAGAVSLFLPALFGATPNRSIGALLLGAAVVGLVARVAPGLARVRAEAAVRLHLGLAFFNLVGAATLGILLAAGRLPGPPLAWIALHAHLAAVGWAVLMAMGFGYRLLPMLLPTRAPTGGRLAASALAIEAGLVALALSARFAPAGRVAAAMMIAGVGAFLAEAARLFAHPLRPGPGRGKRDPPRLHAIQALGWLAVAAVLALVLALRPAARADARWLAAYGVAGLVGFLGHLILAVSAQMLPAWAWIRRFGGSVPAATPPRPGSEIPRGLGWLVLAAWSVGVPTFLAGFVASAPVGVAAGASALAVAVLAGLARILALARGPRVPRSSAPPT